MWYAVRWYAFKDGVLNERNDTKILNKCAFHVKLVETHLIDNSFTENASSGIHLNKYICETYKIESFVLISLGWIVLNAKQQKSPISD